MYYCDVLKKQDMKNVITSNICPPIPTREYDWEAYFEGEEELQIIGYGETEEEAIQELFIIAEEVQDV